MATKMEEIEGPFLDDFVYISDNTYTREQIGDMEETVCGALDFYLWYPTPHHFCDEFIRASNASSRTAATSFEAPTLFQSMVLYLMELSFLPWDLVAVQPSLIAAAAVYLARVSLGVQEPASAARGSPLGYWTKTLQHYTGYNVFELEDVVLMIHQYQMAAEESSLKSAFSKYSKDRFHRVALKTVPAQTDLGF